MNASLVQTNFRLDATVKGELEQVLMRAGTTVTEYLRAVCEKASRGIKDYDEVMAIAVPQDARQDRERTARLLADMALNQQWYAEMAALRGSALAAEAQDAPTDAAPGTRAPGGVDEAASASAGTLGTAAGQPLTARAAGADLPPNAPALNPPIILIDTGLWLDFFLPERPQRASVVELVSRAQAHGIPLAFASQSALDVYQHVQDACTRWWLGGATASDAADAALAPDQPHAGKSDIVGHAPGTSPALPSAIAQAIRAHAWDCVGMMQTYATAIPTDSSDLYLAYKLRDAHNDLGDDLVLAACRRAQANYLVTRSVTLQTHATVCAKTPEGMLAVLDAWS